MAWPVSEPTAPRVPSAMLDEVVLDYLVHYGHLSTASALLTSRSTPNGAPQPLAPVQREQITARQDVCRAITDGRIAEALSLCDTHFPGVLHTAPTPPASDAAQASPAPPSQVSLNPFHVWLNLHIQHYVELVRALYADYAHAAAHDSPMLHAALAEIQLLHTHVQTLPTDECAVYTRQVNTLVALLAYSDADDATRARILDPARRTALAAQVNSAILVHGGHAPDAVLTYITRQAACVLDALHTQQVRVPRGDPLVALLENTPSSAPSAASSIPSSPLLSANGDGASSAREAPTDDVHAARTTVLPSWDAVGFFGS
ncbi:hypothetical protein MBRA1_003137 [Malassezia brasiliensis]|uniref:CTLH/CRA C-terminal to LisH motif domain-containing protein n=1 Tax=Malassezia brasiliensis TaxID=1821822 RepID=A0AAF0IQT8_9BASI|nr:hypothetical protein MBRA1_003137 [Malassezia brasiliensis]